MNDHQSGPPGPQPGGAEIRSGFRPVSSGPGKKIARDFRALAEKECGIAGEFSGLMEQAHQRYRLNLPCLVGTLNPMSEEALNVLRDKRADLIGQIQALHSEVHHIDHAIPLLGGGCERKQNRMFVPGELMRLVGEAQQRAGLSTHREIALHIIRAKKLDATDRALINRVRWSVSECRKRMAARGA